MGRSLTRGRVCRLQLLLVLASAAIFGSVGLATIFYCLRFETSLLVASYNPQGYGGDVLPRLHTGVCVSSVSHSRKTVLRELIRKQLDEQFDSFVVAQRLVVATRITVCLVVTMETLVSVV
jgi:hypothetical protein